MKRHSTEIAIITSLKEARGDYISGEELAERSNVSRAAVWKHIKSLREKGYGIEAVPRRGYRLVSSPQALIPEEVLPILETEILGKRIEFRHTVGSTNALAKELAEKGAEEGTVVIAEQQQQGKGRLGRAWSSPAGGVWLSAVLRPRLLPLEATRFTLLAAVAAAKAIERLGIAPEIKWPNDILVGGKKVCGILLELSAQPDRVEYLVIGFGINANIDLRAVPRESRERATTLAAALGREVDRAALVAWLLRELELGYKHLLEGGWADIVDDWMARCGMVDQQVALSTLHGTVEGTFVGVDDFGAMRLRLPGGEVKTFAAGDATVKKRLT